MTGGPRCLTFALGWLGNVSFDSRKKYMLNNMDFTGSKHWAIILLRAQPWAHRLSEKSFKNYFIIQNIQTKTLNLLYHWHYLPEPELIVRCKSWCIRGPSEPIRWDGTPRASKRATMKQKGQIHEENLLCRKCLKKDFSNGRRKEW